MKDTTMLPDGWALRCAGKRVYGRYRGYPAFTVYADGTVWVQEWTHNLAIQELIVLLGAAWAKHDALNGREAGRS